MAEHRQRRSKRSPQPLFRRYRVCLKPRRSTAGIERVVVVLARTLGAARRMAMQQHPGYVVVSVEEEEA